MRRTLERTGSDRTRRRATAAAVVCLTLVTHDPALAQRGSTAHSDANVQLDARRKALEATEQKARALQADVTALGEEREKLNARLLETARLIQRSESQSSAIEGRLGELEAQEKMIRGSLAQRHDQIAGLMSAMQRMGRNPPPVIVTRREDALQMVRSAMLLAHAFPELREQALALTDRLNELIRVGTEIRAEAGKLRAETQRLNDARTRLSGLMEEKKRSLGERQRELTEVRTAAAEISRNVSDLTELIAKLDKTVAEHTGLGQYDDEMRKASGAPAGRPSPPPATSHGAEGTLPTEGPPAASAGTKVAIATPPPRTAIELVPKGDHGANPGRMKPSVPFHQAKAQLPLPAHGRRVLVFGEKTQYGGQSKGIVLETRYSAQITSPCDGWIVYAGPFRSYGQLLIINAGNGYHILLAGMSQIDVQLGQFVLAAEPVGTMAPASGRASQDSAPVLYIEFRKEGRPIDPEPWWAEGVQRVQG